MRKRGRPVSPEEKKTVKTSNYFLPLDKCAKVQNQFKLPKPLSSRESKIPLHPDKPGSRENSLPKLKRLKEPHSQHTSPSKGGMSGRKWK